MTSIEPYIYKKKLLSGDPPPSIGELNFSIAEWETIIGEEWAPPDTLAKLAYLLQSATKLTIKQRTTIRHLSFINTCVCAFNIACMAIILMLLYK